MHHPKLYIVAGPNGAGKTTFAKKFLPEQVHCLEFVNADLIAAGLSPLNVKAAEVRAGWLMLDRIHELAGQKKDFAFETTLAGLSYVNFLKKMKAGGYEIHLFYLWISDAKLALKRIAERVKAGGHDVPAKVVERRFAKSLNNLFKIYWNLAESVSLIDNSGSIPKAIASERASIREVFIPELFGKIKLEAKYKE